MNTALRLKNYLLPGILIALFLVLRLSLLLTDHAPIDFKEEAACGVLAHDVLSHQRLWHFFDYQFFRHAGATLVNAVVAIPCFLVFGQSIIALKLIPLLFSLGSLILWYLFLRKYFNRSVAFIAGLLCAVSPPYYSRLNLVCALGRIEENFFSIAVITLFFSIFLRPDRLRNSVSQAPLLILCGLISGIALYSFYSFIITLILCLSFWYLLDKSFLWSKKFLLFSASFLAGFTPWLMYNVANRLSGLDVLQLRTVGASLLQSEYYTALVEKGMRLCFYNLPHSLGFDYAHGGGMAVHSVAYYLIFAGCLITLLVSRRNSVAHLFKALSPWRKIEEHIQAQLPLLFILAFPFLFFLIFTVSSFDTPPLMYTVGKVFDFTRPPLAIYRYRYFMQLYPFMFAILAIGIDRFGLHATQRLRKYAGAAVVVYAVMLGLYSNGALVSWDRFGQGFIYRGHQKSYYGFSLIFLHAYDVQEMVQTLDTFDTDLKPTMFTLLGVRIGMVHQGDCAALKDAELTPEPYRKHVYFGIADVVTNSVADDLRKALQFFNTVPLSHQPACYEAYGFRLGSRFLRAARDFSSYPASINAAERALYKKLLSTGSRSPWDITGYVQALDSIDERFKPYGYVGLGRFLGAEERIDEEHFKKIIEGVDTKHRAYVYMGYGKEAVKRFISSTGSLLEAEEIGKRFGRFYGEELGTYTEQFRSSLSLVEDGYKPLVYQCLGLSLSRGAGEPAVADYVLTVIDARYKAYFLKALRGEVEKYRDILTL